MKIVKNMMELLNLTPAILNNTIVFVEELDTSFLFLDGEWLEYFEDVL
jgi:hypothetical protein